jgi:hypothetical protein
MKYIILVFATLALGCTHVQTSEDVKKCCQRLSLHDKEMEKFNRYCKVAVFLSRSNTIDDANVMKNVKTAVDVCKFVFQTDSESDLMTQVELNDMGHRKVRYYIIDSETMFWSDSLPCDPAQFACEEF